MKISYDPVKNAKNISERGISFDDVYDFEWQTARIVPDLRKDYGENRYIAAGFLAGRLHILVFTPTADGIRVISFRKANRRELRRYEAQL